MDAIPPTDPANNVPDPKPKTKKPPKVIEAFTTLCKNVLFPYQDYRVRIVRFYEQPPSLDIREFNTGPDYCTYTKKGITLNLKQAEQLYEQLPDIIKKLMQYEMKEEANVQVPIVPVDSK